MSVCILDDKEIKFYENAFIVVFTNANSWVYPEPG
jgi:hypothetical protein